MLWPEQQLADLKIYVFDVWYIPQHNRAVLGSCLNDKRAATEHAVYQTALVGHLVDPVQRQVLADLVENAAAGDQSAIRDRVRGGSPAQKRHQDQPDRKHDSEHQDGELPDGTGLMRDQSGSDADRCSNEHESKRRQQHRLDVGSGMDHHVLVCAKLLRNSHAVNADTWARR